MQLRENASRAWFISTGRLPPALAALANVLHDIVHDVRLVRHQADQTSGIRRLAAFFDEDDELGGPYWDLVRELDPVVWTNLHAKSDRSLLRRHHGTLARKRGAFPKSRRSGKGAFQPSKPDAFLLEAH
jgi:hypothetical protein